MHSNSAEEPESGHARRNGRGGREGKRREEKATRTEDRGGRRERKGGEGRGNEARRRAYETLSRVAEEGISGHYFLQYFNVKSSGFLEPRRIDSRRRNQAVALAAPGRGEREGEQGAKGGWVFRAGARGVGTMREGGLGELRRAELFLRCNL